MTINQTTASSADLPPSRRIGGWLLLPAISLSLSPVRFAMCIDEAFKLRSSPSWELLTTPTSPAYAPLMKPWFAFDVAAGIFLGVCNLWILWLFFTKSKRLPPVMIAWLAAICASTVIDAILGRAMSLPPKALNELTLGWMQTAATFAIWGTYFFRSVRVKETFTQPDTTWPWIKDKYFLISGFVKGPQQQ